MEGAKQKYNFNFYCSMIEIWLFLNRETPHTDQIDHGTSRTWRNSMIIVLLIPCWLDGSGSNTSDPLPFPYLSAPPSYPDLDPGFETEDDTLSDSGSDEPDDSFSDDSFEQRLAKGRITIKIVSLLRYVMDVPQIIFHTVY